MFSPSRARLGIDSRLVEGRVSTITSKSTRRLAQVRNHLNNEEANETGKIVLNSVSQV